MQSTRHLFDDRRVFALSLAGCFFACCLFNVLHHPMWRDEVRAWQIAASSPTITVLREHLRYEGTPILWYLIVWVITKFTHDMTAMQIVHIFIASCVVFTFAWNGPFSRLAKLLFSFGYFTFFEYATISRSYSLVFLFLLLGAAILSRPRPAPFTLAFVMLLVTQVSVWGVGFAALLMVVGFLQWGIFAETGQHASLWRLLGAVLIVAIGCVFCYFLILPGPSDSILLKTRNLSSVERLVRAIATVWNGWVPVPLWQPTFWGTNILDGLLELRFAFSLLLIAMAVLCLLRRPVALVLLLGGLGGLMAFTFFTQFFGFTRHDGHLFMILVAAIWISHRTREWTPSSTGLAELTAWFGKRRTAMFEGLLAVQVVSGVGANIAGLFIPFSAGKEAAEYIRREVPADVILVGTEDYCMSPIAGYLGREFYFPEIHAFAPFGTQNGELRSRVTQQTILGDFRALSEHGDREILLVLSSNRGLGKDEFDASIGPSATAPAASFHVKLLREFTPSSVGSEAMRLYLVHRVQSP